MRVCLAGMVKVSPLMQSIVTEPQRRGRRARTIRLILESLALLFLVIAFTHPHWLLPLVVSVARANGMEVASGHTEGFDRIVLEGLTGELGGARLSADRVEVALPMAWYLALREREVAPPVVSIVRWQILTGGNRGPGPATGPPGPGEILDGIDSVYATLDRWVPRALLSNGKVVVESADAAPRTLDIPIIEWNDGLLSLILSDEQIPGRLHLSVVRSSDALEVVANLSGSRVGRDLVVDADIRRNGDRLNVDLQLIAGSGRIDAGAELAVTDWRPNRTAIQVTDLEIDPAEYGFPQWPPVRVAGEGSLEDGAWNLDLAGEYGPLDWRGLRFSGGSYAVVAAGNPTDMEINRLELVDSSVALQLVAPVGITIGEARLLNPMRVRFALDRGFLPAPLETSSASGQVHIEAGTIGDPLPFTADLELRPRDPSTLRLAGPLRLEVGGHAAIPSIVLESARALFAGGSEATVRGSIGLGSGELSSIDWELEAQTDDLTALDERLAVVDRLGGSGTYSGDLIGGSGDAALTGAWSGEYAGSAELAFDAVWSNTGLELSDATGDVRVGGRSVRILPGSVVRLDPGDAGRETRVSWADLSLQSVGATLLASGSWGAAGPGVIDLQLSGGDDLPLDIPLADRLILATVRSAAVRLDREPEDSPWFRGHFGGDFTLLLDATAIAVEVDGSLAGGVGVRSLGLSVPGGGNVEGSATVPLRVGWKDGRPAIDFAWQDREWSVDLFVALAGEALDTMTRDTGLEVESLDLRLDGGGLARSPTGRLSLSSGRISRRVEGQSGGTVDRFTGELQIEPEQVRLGETEILVDGVPARLSGALAMTPDSWLNLWTGRGMPSLQDLTGTVAFAAIPLTQLGSLLPELISPVGTATAQVTVRPGLQLSGSLSVDGAATRPLSGGFVARDIQLRSQFSGRRLVLDSLVARINGRPVEGSGFVDLSDPANPTGDLRVTAEAFPMLRETDMVIRGDLDLRVAKDASEEAGRISGSIRLRDGLVTRRLAEFVGRGPAAPRTRPPFFRVEDPRFADWRLDVDIAGREFLRLDTPLLRASGSADFRLEQTLGDPLLVGAASLAGGQLRFPFARLQLGETRAELRRDDPYTFHIAAGARGRAYGYDIELLASGPADALELSVQSYPPLEEESILLMMTAGVVPAEDGLARTRSQQAGRLAAYLGQSLLPISGSGSPGGLLDPEKLTIRTGSEISEQGRENLIIEYQLREGLAVQGEYDEYDDYNATVRWRILSR